jgi:hypothetical protein
LLSRFKEDAMKKGLWATAATVLLTALALASTACGQLAQVNASIGSPKNPGIDQAVVEQIVCAAKDGNVKDAEVYITDRGGSRADITERIARARSRPCPCPAGTLNCPAAAPAVK